MPPLRAAALPQSHSQCAFLEMTFNVDNGLLNVFIPLRPRNCRAREIDHGSKEYLRGKLVLTGNGIIWGFCEKEPLRFPNNLLFCRE